MNAAFILLWMIFFHVVDDFVLQPVCLSSLKQKSYWQENAPDKLYKHDYICALIMHSFSWAFMIMLPIAYANGFAIDYKFIIIFAFNVVIHMLTDHAKANCQIINLWADQIIHISQIGWTFVLLLFT